MPSPANESRLTNDLLRRAREGDQSAFDTLFGLYRDGLKRFVYFRMDARVRPRLDASDIVQETHLEAYQRFDDFYDRRPMPFDVWLRKNALERLYNARRDHVETQKRSVAREQLQPDRSSVMIAGQLAANFATPSECVSLAEYREGVTRTVAELEDADRELLLMRNVEGRSHQEISQLLGIDTATARKRYARVLIRLEKLLIRNGLTDWNR